MHIPYCLASLGILLTLNAGASAPQLHLDARIHQADGSTLVRAVGSGAVLRSGDQVRLQVTPSSAGYVYVLRAGTSAVASLLYPSPDASSGERVAANEAVIVPQDGGFLALNEELGEQLLIAFVAKQPLIELNRLMIRIQAHGGDSEAIHKTLFAAGFESVISSIIHQASPIPVRNSLSMSEMENKHEGHDATGKASPVLGGLGRRIANFTSTTSSAPSTASVTKTVVEPTSTAPLTSAITQSTEAKSAPVVQAVVEPKKQSPELTRSELSQAQQGSRTTTQASSAPALRMQETPLTPRAQNNDIVPAPRASTRDPQFERAPPSVATRRLIQPLAIEKSLYPQNDSRAIDPDQPSVGDSPSSTTVSDAEPPPLSDGRAQRTLDRLLSDRPTSGQETPRQEQTQGNEPRSEMSVEPAQRTDTVDVGARLSGALVAIGSWFTSAPEQVAPVGEESAPVKAQHTATDNTILAQTSNASTNFDPEPAQTIALSSAVESALESSSASEAEVETLTAQDLSEQRKQGKTVASLDEGSTQELANAVQAVNEPSTILSHEVQMASALAVDDEVTTEQVVPDDKLARVAPLVESKIETVAEPFAPPVSVRIDTPRLQTTVDAASGHRKAATSEVAHAPVSEPTLTIAASEREHVPTSSSEVSHPQSATGLVGLGSLFSGDEPVASEPTPALTTPEARLAQAPSLTVPTQQPANRAKPKLVVVEQDKAQINSDDGVLSGAGSRIRALLGQPAAEQGPAVQDSAVTEQAPTVQQAVRQSSLPKKAVLEKSQADFHLANRVMIAGAVTRVISPMGSSHGVLIDDQGHILTTWHDVHAFESVVVVFNALGAQRRKARVIAHSKFSDLALLKVDNVPEAVAPVRIARSWSAQAGTGVHALGYFAGQRQAGDVAHERVSVDRVRRNSSWYSSQRVLHRADVLRAKMESGHNMSGVPLFNDQSELIALSTMVRPEKGELVAVVASTIAAFLAAST